MGGERREAVEAAAGPVEPWRLTLLGGVCAERGTWTVARFSTHKAEALLAYLAFFAGRAHPREALIDLLWPEAPPSAGRASLSTALSSLRHVLEPPGTAPGGVIDATRASVALRPGSVATDVADFEAAIAAAARAGDAAARDGHLDRALARFGGDLLPGHYHDWVAPERERLRRAFLEAAAARVASLREAGERGRALDLAFRAATLDPLSERAQRDLMALEAEAGEAGKALARYRALEKRLETDLDAAPSPETRALARSLEARGASSPSPLPPAPSLAPLPLPPPFPLPPPSPTPLPLPSLAPVALPVLPVPAGPLFGRDDDLAAIERSLPGEARLLTATGPAGIGKTRLAIEAARRLAPRFPGAVFFVPLAEVAEARLLPAAILAVLRPPPAPDLEPLDAVVAALSARAGAPVLLVLDNFEHLATDGSPLVSTLLERVPALACLVTSQRTLGLAAEREVAIGPLPVPSGPDRAAPEDLLALASVRLLIDRARASRPDFQVTAANAAAVAAIVTRLEGIPLALELAAARLAVLAPAQLVARLGARLDLASRRRDVPARHRSLRAALEWSRDLLAPDLAAFLASLSVFRGGFDLEAALAVTGDPLALDRLADLRESSLLVVEEVAPGGESRYRLLETVRDLAAEKVDAGAAAPLRRRHAGFYLDLAERASTRLDGPEREAWVERLALEEANLEAALSSAASDPSADELELRLAMALATYWRVRWRPAEARRRLERAAARAPARSALRGKALGRAAGLALMQGDRLAAHALNEESLSIRREQGDRLEIARGLHNIGLIACEEDDFGVARRHLEEAVALAREVGDAKQVRFTLPLLGQTCFRQGEVETGRRLLEETLSLAREAGDARSAGRVLLLLAEVAGETGAAAAARSFRDEAHALLEKLGDRLGVAYADIALGIADAASGDPGRARARAQAALETFRALRYPQGIADATAALAEAARADGDLDRAESLFRDALARYRDPPHPHRVARMLEAIASLAHARGDRAEARRLRAEAAARRREAGVPPLSKRRRAGRPPRGRR